MPWTKALAWYFGIGGVVLCFIPLPFFCLFWFVPTGSSIGEIAFGALIAIFHIAVGMIVLGLFCALLVFLDEKITTHESELETLAHVTSVALFFVVLDCIVLALIVLVWLFDDIAELASRFGNIASFRSYAIASMSIPVIALVVFKPWMKYLAARLTSQNRPPTETF